MYQIASPNGKASNSPETSFLWQFVIFVLLDFRYLQNSQFIMNMQTLMILEIKLSTLRVNKSLFKTAILK